MANYTYDELIKQIKELTEKVQLLEANKCISQTSVTRNTSRLDDPLEMAEVKKNFYIAVKNDIEVWNWRTVPKKVSSNLKGVFNSVYPNNQDDELRKGLDEILSDTMTKVQALVTTRLEHARTEAINYFVWSEIDPRAGDLADCLMDDTKKRLQKSNRQIHHNMVDVLDEISDRIDEQAGRRYSLESSTANNMDHENFHAAPTETMQSLIGDKSDGAITIDSNLLNQSVINKQNVPNLCKRINVSTNVHNGKTNKTGNINRHNTIKQSNKNDNKIKSSPRRSGQIKASQQVINAERRQSLIFNSNRQHHFKAQSVSVPA